LDRQRRPAVVEGGIRTHGDREVLEQVEKGRGEQCGSWVSAAAGFGTHGELARVEIARTEAAPRAFDGDLDAITGGAEARPASNT